MDLKFEDFTLPDEGVLEIKKADGTPSGWKWRLAGPGHPATIAADERQLKYFLDRADDQERARVNYRKWKGGDETVAAVQERGIDYCAARVLGWNEDLQISGAPFPCTPENVRKAFANRAWSIFDQVNDYLRDERSFTKRSATT